MACLHLEGSNAIVVGSPYFPEKSGIERAVGGGGQTMKALPAAPVHCGGKADILRSRQSAQRLTAARVVVYHRLCVGAYLRPERAGKAETREAQFVVAGLDLAAHENLIMKRSSPDGRA